MNSTQYMEKIVAFICDTNYEDLPYDSIEGAKTRIMDCIGVAFKGGEEEVGAVIKEFIKTVDSKPQATVIGSDIKTDYLNAAFANGTLMHAIDFDDHFILSHPSICVVPSMLAVGEKVQASGRDLILSYIIGLELYTKVQQCTSTEPWYRGFHATGIWGTISAVGTAAKLLKLNKQQTTMALGTACSTFCGLKRNMGTHTKPYHCGRSVEGGVRSAILASLGFTSHPEAFEGKFGYLHVFCTSPRFEYIDQLGKQWDIIDTPTHIKPHPSCGGTHAAMNGMLELINKHEIKEELVVRIDVGMNQGGVDSLYYPEPRNIYEAKFSMHFCIALILHFRRWGLSLHTDEVVNLPEMRTLYPKVNFYVDEKLDKEIDRDYTDYHAIVTVVMKDGTTYSTRSTLPYLNFEQAHQKFCECTEGIISPERRDAIIARILELDQLEKASDLTTLL